MLKFVWESNEVDYDVMKNKNNDKQKSELKETSKSNTVKWNEVIWWFWKHNAEASF